MDSLIHYCGALKALEVLEGLDGLGLSNGYTPIIAGYGRFVK